MTKILVAIDGSAYADNICKNAAWAAKRLNAEVNLLHVLRRHSDYEAPSDDHTGSVGFGARTSLQEELAKVDAERGKLDLEKGRLILQHAEDELKKADVTKINTLHRRGSLSDTITELEPDMEMIFIGKRGEQANMTSEFLGSNLEKVARLIHKPLFLVSHYMRPIKKFVIAFDGKENAQKAVNYIATSPLLKGLECHLLTIESGTNIDTTAAVKKLKKAGFNVITHKQKQTHIDEDIKNYVNNNEIDLLITGSYSHSRIRTMLLGSTTTALIKSCHIPILLFR